MPLKKAPSSRLGLSFWLLVFLSLGVPFNPPLIGQPVSVAILTSWEKPAALLVSVCETPTDPQSLNAEIVGQAPVGAGKGLVGRNHHTTAAE